MAEYNLFLNAEVQEANKKLDSVDKKLDQINKKADGLNIQFPNLDQVVKGFEATGKAIKFVWDQSDGLLGNIHPLWAALGDVKELLGRVTDGASDLGTELQKLRKLMPTTIVGTGFEAASNAINSTAQATARLGYVFFGLQQSVNLVAGTFNTFFDSTIRRQAQLEATILQTRTTLASTARVLADGMELRDPLQAIQALEGPIEETIASIRRRSLEIAGTTSEAIIQTFSVVAGQIGQIGGDLKDAEDLAISFAAALGTIGLSNPMYATQEIRSILTGNIDQNSVLARSLGITNEDIQKAKTSSEGLVRWLENRLAAFGAGQGIAATQLSGVLSNVLEVYQEFTRELGKPLLEPLVNSANAVFERLSSIFKQLLDFAGAVGYAFSSLYQLLQTIVGSSNFNLVSDKQIADSLDSVSLLIGDFVADIKSKLQEFIVPKLVQSLNNIKNIIEKLTPSVLKLIGSFVQLQVVRFEVVIDSLEYTLRLFSDLAPAINMVLGLYTQLMSQPLLQYFVQLGQYVKIFEDLGVNAVARLVVALAQARNSIKTIFTTVGNVGSFVGAIPGKIKRAVTSTVSSIEKNVLSLTTKIIQLVADLGIIIVATVTKLAKKAKLVFVEIAAQADATGTAIGASIAKGALAAAGAMDQLGNAAKGSIDGLEKLREDAPEIADNLGKTYSKAKKGVLGLAAALRVNLVKGIKAAGKALKATAISFAKFTAQMAIATIAIGALVQIWSKISENLRVDKVIREGVAASRELATTFKDVNEESSKFMQAMKQRALDAENNAIEELVGKLDKLKDRYKKAQETLAKFRKESARGNEFGSRQRLLAGNSSDAEVNIRRAEATIKRIQDYKNQLEDLYRQQAERAQRQADKRTVSILNKERTGLEEKIKKEREKVARALADYEFQLRQRIESNLQSEREAQQRVDLARIQKAQDLAKDGLSGVARTVADIIDDYQNELLRIENERLRREFDLKQQVASLAKDVADYEFRLAEQKAKIDKQVGNFNTKVADYVREQDRRRHEENMRAAIKEARVRASGFVQFGDQIKDFKNAAAGAGLSATNLLSFLYAGGAQELGVTADTKPEALIAALRSSKDFAQFKAGNLGFNDFLDKYVTETLKKDDGAAVAAFARQSAQNDLATTFKLSSPPAPPKMEELAFETKGFVEERRRANEQLAQSIAKLNETLNRTSRALADLKLEEFGRRSLLTDLPGLSDLIQQGSSSRLRLAVQQAAGQAGGRVDDEVMARSMIEFNKAIVETGIKVGLSGEAQAKALDNLNARYKQLQAELPETIAKLKEIKQLDALSALEADINRLREQTFDLLIETSTQALEAFAGFGEESERRLAQVRIEQAVAARRLQLQRDGIELNEEALESLERFRKGLEAGADAQEELRLKLKPLYERLALATEAAATLTDAYKSAAKSLLAGGDITEISRNFAQALAGKTIDTFVEWVFKDMQKQLEEVIGDVLGLGNVEEQIKNLLQTYISQAEAQAEQTLTALEGLTETLKEEIQKVITALKEVFAPPTGQPASSPTGQSATTAGGIPIGTVIDDLIKGPVNSADPNKISQQNGQGGPSLPVQEMSEAANTINLFRGATEAVGRNAAQAAEATEKAAQANADQATTAEQVQGALAGATQMLMGVGMVASGISQIKEGGTSNTLLGIGQVLMGVGSFGLGLGRMFAAQGAYVNTATPAMIGEGGTPEYVIPENKMASSMARYAQGMRGNSVVEGADISFGSSNRSQAQPTALGDASRRFNPGNRINNVNNYGTDASVADNFSINITGEQLVFNEKNYVSQDEIPNIISQASKQGEARTLRKLRMSQSTRSRTGF